MELHGFAYTFTAAEAATVTFDGAAGNDQITLSGPGYENRVLGFADVQAFAYCGANDTAQLTGTDKAELTDGNLQQGSLPSGVTANYVAWLSEFEEIKVKRPATGAETTTDATDKLVAAIKDLLWTGLGAYDREDVPTPGWPKSLLAFRPPVC